MKEIKKYLENKIGDFSFYFEDLRSGYTYGFHQNRVFPTGGSILLPISIALLKEIENGNVNFEDVVVIKEKERYNSACGILHLLDKKEYVIKELLIAITVQNDYTAANKILDVIGVARFNELFKEMGLKETMLKHRLTRTKLNKDEAQNCSTSYELSKCFELLYKKEYLNKEHSDYLVNLFSRNQLRNKIPFYLPSDSCNHIANKSGKLDKIEVDSSLITISKGDFVFTVMCKDLPSNVYGTSIIARMSKMMWDIIDGGWR